VNSLTARTCAAALVMSLAACAKKPDSEAQAGRAAVSLVPEAERSRHFEAVNGHLELGGVLYGYADVDGDALSLAGSAQALVRQIAIAQPQLAPIGKKDFKELFSELGLNDVKAIGFSSVREAGGGFRNRTFIYTPDGRHGLFAVFGGQPGRFVGSKLAPPDADFYSECEFDVTALYDTVKAVVAKMSGPDAAASLEKKLKEAGAQSGYSLLDIVEGLNGRLTIIVRMDPGITYDMPGPKPVKVPAFSAVLRVEGIGAALEGALSKNASLVSSQDGSLHLFTKRAPIPMAGLLPVLAVDGKTIYAATSAAFLHECLNRTAGLETNPQFAAGLAAFGPEGNGLTWVSQGFFARLREIGSLNPEAAPELRRTLDVFAANLPMVTQPLFSLRSNLPDGILVRSSWNSSLKSNVAMFTVYNPVTIGLVAAMAIPAFQKVQQASQAKTALNRPPAAAPQRQVISQNERILENLRLLDEAANKYYADHDATTTTLEQLVGLDKYLPAIRRVAGEDYRTLLFKKGRPLRLYLRDGRVIVYPPQ
jgi:type IV pilus assembly protein PilA